MVRDILQPERTDTGPLMSEGPAIWLDHSLVRVDVEEFLARADVALDAHRRNQTDAKEQLMAALAAHTGDFLEDDPYEDWAAPLAEEIRAKHIALLRASVETVRASGDVDQVIEYGLKLLEQDAYDEDLRLELVAALLDAGRRGEARRHYEIYAQRMREIDVEPQPMPRPRRAGSSDGSATDPIARQAPRLNGRARVARSRNETVADQPIPILRSVYPPGRDST